MVKSKGGQGLVRGQGSVSRLQNQGTQRKRGAQLISIPLPILVIRDRIRSLTMEYCNDEMTMNDEERKRRDIPDEDDPLVALRQHRREISDRYETVEELTAYLKQFHSVEDALARVRAKIAGKEKSMP